MMLSVKINTYAAPNLVIIQCVHTMVAVMIATPFSPLHTPCRSLTHTFLDMMFILSLTMATMEGRL